MKKIIKKIIQQNPETAKELTDLKRQLAASFKIPSPSNINLLRAYRELRKKKKTKKNKILESLLKKREVRTLSGVAPIAVLTKPYPCPGQCIYCPTEKKMPKSYLSNEPAVMRAILCNFNPYKQVTARLNALELEGHDTDKIELIIMGGTWSYLPKKYQLWFITECFRACNSLRHSEHIRFAQYKLREESRDKQKITLQTLKRQQKKNEVAKHRIIGLTLETRPDFINPEEIKWMRELGSTRIEIGVQTIYNSILELICRGHKVKETIKATKLLKDAGFKVSYHMMPNLPGSSPARDIKMFKELFSNPSFQPDMLKIYPCVVTKNSELYNWWKKGKYKPYRDKKLLETLIKIKTLIPYYVRLTRLIRDIPKESIIAGNKISNLREYIHREMKNRKLICKCIRCREIGHSLALKGGLQKGALPLGREKKPKLFVTKYKASDGIEYFLSLESPDRKVLYAFLRLRIPDFSQDNKNILFEINNAALIRELHTYGHLVPISKKQKGAIQHFGLGKKLMSDAEKIVKKLGIRKIAVISGIGVRKYYQKLGYRLEGTYMVKELK